MELQAPPTQRNRLHTCRVRKCPFSAHTCSTERPHRSWVSTRAPCISRSWTIRCWLVAAANWRAVCRHKESQTDVTTLSLYRVNEMPASHTCPLCSLKSRQPLADILFASAKARARRPFATAMWSNLAEKKNMNKKKCLQYIEKCRASKETACTTAFVKKKKLHCLQATKNFSHLVNA